MEASTHPYFSQSWVADCKKYPTKAMGYSYLQAMRYAVEQINNSSLLLPGISLGYEMVDICYHSNAVHPLLFFLSDNRSLLEIQASNTFYRPRVMAVIGPDVSSTAVTAAYLLSNFFVPQISYSATMESLSNPRTFPAAFRTIPSTEQQIVILLNLLRSFRWNWVIVLYSEDEYGQTNLHQLRAQATWACVAFQESIPFWTNDRPALAKARIQNLVERIKGSSAKVVIVLSTEVPLWRFFEEAVWQNVTGFVWIAAEAWAMDSMLRDLPGISRLGTFIGIAPEKVAIPGLDDFRVRPSGDPPDGAEARADPAMCNQECDDCLFKAQEMDPILRATGSRIEFNVYSAVYAVAHALHRVLGCNATGCRHRTVYPWQLLKEMSQVRFSLLNITINFDEKGDPPNGFEVLEWLWDTPGKPFQRIASYSELNELHIDAESILWHTENNTVPKSVCSEQCEPGQMKKHLASLSCCFECVECKPGTFLNQSSIFSCQSCPPDMWSHAGQEECFLRSVRYLQWDSPVAIFLLFFTFLGLLTAGGLLLIFVRHANTPVVRSAGGPLCFLMIASLIVGFCSLFFYIGQPTEVKCICRRMVFSLCFTICMACMSVRSFQIMCVFKMASRLPRAYNAWVRYNGQWIFVATAFTLKVVIVGMNLYFFPPLPLQSAVSSSDPAVLILTCNPNYLSAIVFNNVLEMVLSFACFCFAYTGKALPKNYNEAKYITLCMTSYFTCWVVLVVVMAVCEGVVVTAFDVVTGLLNLLSVCIGYFGPKCYVILFRPEQNTLAFFQTAIQSYTMRPA
nr:taste receptor type 1 member 2 [Pogona vitticeps]